MSIYLKATVDNNNSINTTFSSPETLYLYDNTTGEISEDPLTTYPTAKISLSQRDQFVDNKLFEGGINYTNTFNEKHDFSAMLVVNYQDYRNRYMTGTNNDMAGKYPEVIGTATDSKLVGNEYFYQRASLIGRFTYGYDNRYFIEQVFVSTARPNSRPTTAGDSSRPYRAHGYSRMNRFSGAGTNRSFPISNSVLLPESWVATPYSPITAT